MSLDAGLKLSLVKHFTNLCHSSPKGSSSWLPIAVYSEINTHKHYNMFPNTFYGYPHSSFKAYVYLFCNRLTFIYFSFAHQSVYDHVISSDIKEGIWLYNKYFEWQNCTPWATIHFESLYHTFGRKWVGIKVPLFWRG